MSSNVLHIVSCPPLAEVLESAAPADLAIASGMVSERRKCEFLTWRALARKLLAPILGVAPQCVNLGYNGDGAPIVLDSELYISVSHCVGYVAVMVGDNRCGIDIERLDRNFEIAKSKYMTPATSAVSQEPSWTAKVWCAKEALYKVAGTPALSLLNDISIASYDPCVGQIVAKIHDQIYKVKLQETSEIMIAAVEI